ncbi:MAG: hypothetical protein HC880_03725 [Bacteroidia bacterium]|nr:hypothetical protein [Bacteroidia bacterium]
MPALLTKNTNPAKLLNLQAQPNNRGPQSSSGQGFGLFSGKFENNNPFLEALRKANPPAFQAKRTIGQPNDPYEQERRPHRRTGGQHASARTAEVCGL